MSNCLTRPRQSKLGWRVLLSVTAGLVWQSSALSLPQSDEIPSDRRRPENPFTVTGSAPFPVLQNKLRGREGFVGGDGAYSIVLSPHKTLWLFGDSFIGKLTAEGKRKDCKMVRNTIAVDDPSRASSSPVFYNQSPAFFRLNDGNFYWPGDGAMLNGKLYLTMHETEVAPKQQPPFQFNPLTDNLIIVQNPLAEPSTWKIRTFKFNNRSSNRQIGTACLLDGYYFYMYVANSAVRMGIFRNPTSLCRLKKSDLEAGRLDRLQWLAEGKWQDQAAFLDTLFDDGTSEMTVTKVQGLPGFFAFYLPFGNKALMMRHADHPEGPWSKPVVAHKLPQVPRDIFFYSAKAHPQYTTGKGEIGLTYCSNSSVFSRVINDSKLYFPEAVKIKIAPAK
ncbi:MAG: DUF4185 domain-containing protein [Cyanobacteria bacterium SZAS LIN-2]|nr:DUF4185 domain-containing protein [Cyanobacteria bacterium SZAS LIN-2]